MRRLGRAPRGPAPGFCALRGASAGTASGGRTGTRSTKVVPRPASVSNDVAWITRLTSVATISRWSGCANSRMARTMVGTRCTPSSVLAMVFGTCSRR